MLLLEESDRLRERENSFEGNVAILYQFDNAFDPIQIS